MIEIDDVENIYKTIDEKLKDCDFFVDKNKKKKFNIDNIFLNRYFGLPIFIFIIFFFLGFSFFCGQIFSNIFEYIIQYIIDILKNISFLQNFVSSSFFNCFVNSIESILQCCSLIFFLHFFLFFIEGSGYLSRGVFLVDKLLKSIGLNGDAFIPLITNLGCNVPGILATKTLKDKKIKYITIFISPMISCPAKLPIYLFLSSFFLTGIKQSLFILTIYIIGILAAILVSKIFSKFVNNNKKQFNIIEIPKYNIPNIKNIVLLSFSKVLHFIKTVGPFIIIFSFIIWFLQNYPNNKHFNNNTNKIYTSIENKTSDILENTIDESKENIYEDKYIYKISKIIEPLFKPIGFNWKMDIAMIGGIFAKESIPAVLKTLYTKDKNNEHKDNIRSDISFPTTISFLFFILFYCPCINTILVVFSEIGLVLTIFLILFYSLLSYCFSFFLYKIFSIFYF